MASSSKWLNSGVTTHQGSFLDIVKHVPSFDRFPFAIPSTEGTKARANGRLDTIVRLPIGEDSECVPVGVVSRDYALLQHSSVCDEAKKALEEAKIDPGSVDAELRLTELGERMKLSLRLPDNYLFDPGDKFPVTVRLECLNSVDGSTRFRAVMGWFRLVCSNGLTIGITQSESDRRHVGDFQFGDIGNILRGGLGEYKLERDTLILWQNLEVGPTKLRAWVDTDLRVGWGFKAATRAFHIATSGRDVTVLGPYRGIGRRMCALKLPTQCPVHLKNPRACLMSARSWRGWPRNARTSRNKWIGGIKFHHWLRHSLRVDQASSANWPARNIRGPWR